MENRLKVLFVASGNSKDFEIAPFIKAQGESLVSEGIEICYFSITGKGITGYLRGAIALREYLRGKKFDIIHAHYSLSGWTAVLSFPSQPVVLSLMGSDTYGEFVAVNKIRPSSNLLVLLTKLIQPFVAAIICKSKHIESYVYLKKKSQVIPNGIQLDNVSFNFPISRNELGLEQNKKYILFLGSRNNVRKNFSLAEKALKQLDEENLIFLAPYPVKHNEVIRLLNVVDCLVVPSFMEGSPNVIKEAMACNCPVVATDVGDVSWLFGNEPGHFICSFDPEDVAGKIRLALDFAMKHGRTQGRKRLIELGLHSETTANKIIKLYQKVLKKK